MPAQIVWHSLHSLPLVVALAVLIALAVVWLYPSQVRRVRRPWRWVLPGLRVTALLVLTAALLQPAVRRLRRADERGAVLLLVDRSRSMAVSDSTRSPAQLVALADAFGHLPKGIRAAAMAGVVLELERLRDRVADVASAGNDAETAEAFGRGVEGARARLSAARTAFAEAAVALSARSESVPAAGELRARLAAIKDVPDAAPHSWAADARARIDAVLIALTAAQGDVDRQLYASNAGVKSACDELARLSRWSLVEQALLRPKTGLISQISPNMPVAGYTFSDTVEPIPLNSSPPRFLGAPNGRASNIAGAPAAALAGTGGRPVRAVVVFSDGRHIGGEAAIVSGMIPAGVPVFTIGVAPAERGRDLAFDPSLSVPDSAFVGETLVVRAAITAAGMPAGATEVQLRVGDLAQSQRVELKPDGTPTPVAFSLQLKQGGPQKVVVSIPPAPGEITAENNVMERWIKVLPERMKVAAYAGTPGWDFQFLREALTQTAWVKPESGILDAVTPRLDMTPEQILQQDVIVLSDVPAGALDDVQWDAVNRFVRERGGSLFLLAGPDYLPATYTPATIVPSALLPYDVKKFTPNWRTWPGEEPAFRFSPAPDIGSELSDAFRLGPGAGTLGHWQSLGGAFRFMPLAELNARLNTRALLVEADSRMPVLTESFPGNGRVLFLGVNETWRWRFKVGGRDFRRFWLQLMRYAAGAPYAVQGDLVALDVDKVAPAPHDPLTIRTRILQGGGDGYRVEVWRDGAVVQSPALVKEGQTGGGRYVATVAGLDEGDYVVRLFNPADDNPAAAQLEMAIHVVAGAGPEMADVSGDEGLLRRVAQASGGEFLPIDRMNELPGLLAATGEDESHFSEVPIWNSPLLFVFVVACFGAEWAVRKRCGLA